MAEYIERDKVLESVLGLPPKMDEQGYGWLGRMGVWQMLNDIPAEDVQPVKWISVYDQLPDYNMVVLVTDGEDVGTGYRYALGETGFMGWAIPFADIEEDDVSHWLPLPEPPKDGET